MSDYARVPDHTPAEVIARLQEDIEAGNVNRVVIIWIDNDPDSEEIAVYSNARSEAEQIGMMHGALYGKDTEE